MKIKKYNMGGSLQSLLPLLDLAAPGLGTAASAVAGVLSQANAFTKQSKQLQTPTNPFRSYRDGGKMLYTSKLNETKPNVVEPNIQQADYYVFDSNKVVKNKDGSLTVQAIEDIRTGKAPKETVKIFRNKDGSYSSDVKSELNTQVKDVKDYYKNLYRSDFYKRNFPDINTIERSAVAKSSKFNLLTKEEVKKRDTKEERELGNGTSYAIRDLGKSVIDPNFVLRDGRDVIAHEMAHLTNMNRWNNEKLRKYIDTSKPSMREHDKHPEELHADIHTMRYLMNQLGIWDMKRDFKEEDWDKLKKKSTSYLIDNVEHVVGKDKKKITKLLNTVAQNETPKQEQNMIARKGGLLPKLEFGGKLKEHNLPSHEQGGGLVDKMGNPASTGAVKTDKALTDSLFFQDKQVAEIEKQESVYTSQKGKTPYVFSDTLKDSNGQTFSQNAKSVERKFGKPDQISKTTYKKLMDELMMKNEIAKKLQEQAEAPTEQAQEGNPQMPNGGVLGNTDLTNLINKNRTTSSYNNLLGNLQSGAFPRVPRVDKIPSGAIGILDNARANPLISQTAPKVPDITNPAIAQTTPNAPGGLDLGKVGGILKGVALAGSAIDAFQKPEEEQLRVPDFSKGDKAYAGLGTSFDPIRNDIVQQAKSGENQIMQSSGNFGQVMSRLNALQAGVGRNLAQVGLQEKQYNDQIRMSKGSREDQNAQIIANEQIRQQIANSQNKAMGQDLVANLLQNVNNYGTEFMKQDATMKELQSLDKQAQRDFLTKLSLLNIQNPNFQIDKNLINSDNPLSALTFKK